MPIPQFTGLGPRPQYEDIVNKVNALVMELRNLMLGMDSVNMFEVGGWLVTSDQLASQDGDVGMSTEGTNPTSIRFWAGNVAPSSAPFRVQQDGKVIATDGEFTGIIIAESGTIGGWTIEEDKLSGSGAIEGGSITGSTVQTAASGSRIVMVDGIITVYDSSGVKSITIDSTSTPPKTNYYDASGALIASIARAFDTLFISSENGFSITDNTALTVGKSGISTDILGEVKISGATSPLNDISQFDSTATTVAELVTDFNTLLSNLRSMNILD